MNDFIDSNDPEFTSFGSGFISGFRDNNSYNQRLAESINNQAKGITRADDNIHKYNRLIDTDKKMKFRIEEQDLEYKYTPSNQQFSFYQICSFSIDGKKHKVRKIYYDEIGDVIKHNETLIKKSKLEKFINKCQKHKYSLYPAYDLETVGFPQDNEITMAMSRILNNF